MEYDECLQDATQRYNKGKLKLCPRGYCTAKQKFEVYPSAYANGYAVQVCQGTKPDFQEETVADEAYTSRLKNTKASEATSSTPAPTPAPARPNGLQRWFQEEWVNVCESGDGPGGYARCGSGNGVDDPENYPYCRPYYKQAGTTIVTAPELSEEELAMMCTVKRSLPQGVDGRPTRVFLADNVAPAQAPAQAQVAGDLEIPNEVREAAQLGLDLREKGYAGGTQTGWDRGAQLAEDADIDALSLADMRTWFARHGPDASSGGTSYPGYCNWLSDGSPMSGGFKNYKGAVSWLLWGGNPAYLWLKSSAVRDLLDREFPTRKRAVADNNLSC